MNIRRITLRTSAVGLAICLGGLGLGCGGVFGTPPTKDSPPANNANTPRVETARPTAGGLSRFSVQPGSVRAFEAADLYAKVPGFLRSQTVDIGSHVKAGEVIAEIDSPELVQDLEHAKSTLELAHAEVKQAEARVITMAADQKATESAIVQAEADVKRYEAERTFRQKQHQRMKDLFALKSIEERLVDEKLEQYNAAEATVRSAQAAVRSAKDQALAAMSRVEQAKADLLVEKAKVRVDEAKLARAQAMVDYLMIRSPYAGVITHRSYHRGDFIRAADNGGNMALLRVERTDLMRVVVQIPDRDVPFTNAGDPVTLKLDALPKETFAGQLSRISESEHEQTRSMRVEIDLPNPKGILRDGMYGQVTVEIEPAPADAVTIPSGSQVGETNGDKAQVYVVKNGLAQLTSIKIGKDNGSRLEVLQGLTTDDEVITRPSTSVANGKPVVTIPAK